MTDELSRDEPGELTTGERAALEAWAALPPPPGFADRVLAARAAEEPAPARAPTPGRATGDVRRRLAAIAGIVSGTAVAAAAIGYLATRPVAQPIHGRLDATARTEAALGDRAVAVAEAAASIAWRIDAGGAAEIDHTAGDVFYRVDRGGPFVVHTPAGDVRVTGTCFRVEVDPMWNKKHALVSGAAGAAIAAAVVVTVYEGHVIAETRAARTELPAGSRAALGADGRATVTEVAAGDSGGLAAATRDELIARTGVQRAELARLRARVAELERASGDAKAGGKDGDDSRPFYDPTPEQLAQWAAECHVRSDTPSFDRYTPIPPNTPNDRGIEPAEIPAINAALGEVNQRWRALLRALYVEATGDTAGAESLSLEAIRGELGEKSRPGEHNEILQKLARERAGLAAPPVDLAKTSPLERMMRAMIGLGDETEAAIAKRLGAARAREIRGKGWSSRNSWTGCPGE